MGKFKRKPKNLILLSSKKTKKTKGLNNKTLNQKNLSSKEKKLLALQLRREGKTYQFISDTIDVPISKVHLDIGIMLRKEIEQQTKVQKKQIVQLELDRLDLLFDKAWAAIEGGNQASIDKAIKIMERRARYLGLDAPSKSLVGEDNENPFNAGKGKLKTLLHTMIKNKEIQSKKAKVNKKAKSKKEANG